MKVDYVKLVLLQFMRSQEFDELWGTSWILDENYRDLARRSIGDAFDNQSILLGSQNYDEQFDELFEELVSGKAVAYDGDDYSDRWLKINFTHKNKLVDQSIANNAAQQRIGRLGSEAFGRALRKIAKEDGHLYLEAESGVPESSVSQEAGEEIQRAPASDRIITFNHNQVVLIEEPLDDLIEKVEKENGINGDGGLRDLILGRLKAGKELVRAAIFSAESLQLTLIVGLRMLVDQYGDHAISAAAGNLLALLIEAVRNA